MSYSTFKNPVLSGTKQITDKNTMSQLALIFYTNQYNQSNNTLVSLLDSGDKEIQAKYKNTADKDKLISQDQLKNKKLNTTVHTCVQNSIKENSNDLYMQKIQLVLRIARDNIRGLLSRTLRILMSIRLLKLKTDINAKLLKTKNRGGRMLI